MSGNRTSGTIRFVIKCQERRFFIKGNEEIDNGNKIR